MSRWRFASASLTDEAVADAIGSAAALVRERSAAVLEANEADYDAATGRLDEGTHLQGRLRGVEAVHRDRLVAC